MPKIVNLVYRLGGWRGHVERNTHSDPTDNLRYVEGKGFILEKGLHGGCILSITQVVSPSRPTPEPTVAAPSHPSHSESKHRSPRRNQELQLHRAARVLLQARAVRSLHPVDRRLRQLALQRHTAGERTHRIDWTPSSVVPATVDRLSKGPLGHSHNRLCCARL